MQVMLQISEEEQRSENAAMAHCEPNSCREPRGLAEVNAIAVDEVIPSMRKPKLRLHHIPICLLPLA